MDPAVHRTLVREHGWTRPEYANWIQAHDHGRAPQGYLEGGMTGGVLTIGRLIVTASRAARQAVPEAEGHTGVGGLPHMGRASGASARPFIDPLPTWPGR
jgi:O-antigen ligase